MTRRSPAIVLAVVVAVFAMVTYRLRPVPDADLPRAEFEEQMSGVPSVSPAGANLDGPKTQALEASLPSSETDDVASGRAAVDSSVASTINRSVSHTGSLQPSKAAELIVGDFPAHLEFATGHKTMLRTPDGCKLATGLLAEMSEEKRDNRWAARIERELIAMLTRHMPPDLRLSVGCRSTICQVTAVSDANTERRANWFAFEKDVESSPIAHEFTSMRFFGGRSDASDLRIVSGFVLTSAGQADEPSICQPMRSTSVRSDMVSDQ